MSDTSYGDLPEFIDFNYASNVARVNAAALASLALAPSPPAEGTIFTRNLEYSTEQKKTFLLSLSFFTSILPADFQKGAMKINNDQS